MWCKVARGNQAVMVKANPDRFFVPPYVGTAGWIGIRLDKSPDWAEIGELMRDAYRLIAPKRLLPALDAG